MNQQELEYKYLIPRYKVIALYPNCIYKLGQIIELDWHKYHWVINAQKNHWDKYPHIFRLLEWWEDRDVKDMPGYVKCIKTPDNFHFPDRVYRINYLNGIAYSDISIVVVFETNCYLPATETEYLNQNNQP